MPRYGENVFTRIMRSKDYSKFSAREALRWYVKKIQSLGQVTPERLLSSRKSPYAFNAMDFLGNLYFFRYDPKTKEKMKYYDKFPLIVPIGLTADGFLGLNLHYLPIGLRVAFFAKLLDFATDDNYDLKTKMQARYDFLKGAARFREFIPCIKRYLLGHVESKFIRLNAPEWEISLYLPVQQFEKRTAAFVWKESNEKIFGTIRQRATERKAVRTKKRLPRSKRS